MQPEIYCSHDSDEGPGQDSGFFGGSDIMLPFIDYHVITVKLFGGTGGVASVVCIQLFGTSVAKLAREGRTRQLCNLPVYKKNLLIKQDAPQIFRGSLMYFFPIEHDRNFTTDKHFP
ncbi:hypothetical protein SAY86_003547 [Trapa natans]|uniref:Uncharacterized protein n=1 Tax=Trapa natans TaxID=22666 RepID=A0AAN7MCZ8_TRANT|nr:hypothetical protein SAY86_003547 [Trapa natans]